MGSFEFNEAGSDQGPRDSEMRFAGLHVPLSGSDNEAVHSVTEQLRRMGVTPDDAKVRKIVNRARESHDG